MTVLQYLQFFHFQLNLNTDQCWLGEVWCHVHDTSKLHLLHSAAFIKAVAMQHEWRHLPTVCIVPWDSRESSLSPRVKWISRSRRWQLHFHRNKQILRVGREISETDKVWSILIFWGRNQIIESCRVPKKKNFQVYMLFLQVSCIPFLLYWIYLQVLLTVNAVHKYLFLLRCFQPSFNYSWSEGECQRGGQTETLEALRLPNIWNIRCATSLRVEGVSCHNQYN